MKDRLIDNGAIEIDNGIRGGVPVISGTAFPVSRLLAELGAGEKSPCDVAIDFELDEEAVLNALNALAWMLDCDWSE